jgi:hypothetical protein
MSGLPAHKAVPTGRERIARIAPENTVKNVYSDVVHAAAPKHREALLQG